jgi:drug/metabolite transporter superfamily protein YnfA
MSAFATRTDRAINAANVALGGMLIVSPWLFGFTSEHWATWNAWLSGGVVVLIALPAVVRVHDREEWLNVIGGLWIAASPWLLWFNDVRPALWAHITIGLCIVGIAAVELRRLSAASEDVVAPGR